MADRAGKEQTPEVDAPAAQGATTPRPAQASMANFAGQVGNRAFAATVARLGDAAGATLDPAVAAASAPGTADGKRRAPERGGRRRSTRRGPSSGEARGRAKRGGPDAEREVEDEREEELDEEREDDLLPEDAAREPGEEQEPSEDRAAGEHPSADGEASQAGARAHAETAAPDATPSPAPEGSAAAAGQAAAQSRGPSAPASGPDTATPGAPGPPGAAAAPAAAAPTAAKTGAGAEAAGPTAPGAAPAREAGPAGAAGPAGPVGAAGPAVAAGAAGPAGPAAPAPAREGAPAAAPELNPAAEPVARRSVPAAAFTAPDVATILGPADPQQDQAARSAAEAQTSAELTSDASTATQSVDAFVGERRGRTDQLAALRPQVQASVEAAQTEAVAAIDASLAQQVDGLGSTVAAQLQALATRAKAARGQLTATHEATTARITAASATAREQITAAAAATGQRATTAESTQLTRLGTLYTQIEGRFREAARSAGGVALREGNRRAGEFRTHKINREDGFWDGYLTDNRCEAEAEAAEKVGAAYRDELGKEGDKQVEAMQARRPTDEAAIRQVTTETRGSLQAATAQAMTIIADTERASIANAAAAKTQLLSQIDETEQRTRAALTQHQATQLAELRELAEGRKASVRESATQTITSVGEAVDAAVADVDGALELLVAQLAAGPLPDPLVLTDTLAGAGAQLDERMTSMVSELETQSTAAVDGVRSAGQDSAAAVADAGRVATDAAREAGTGGTDAISTIQQGGVKSLGDLAQAHDDGLARCVQGHRTGADAILQGQTDAYERFNTNFAEGAQRNVDAVREGLTAVATHDIHGVITEEAAKARSQVLPRWKSVLKWVIIIALVLAVAIVIGPLVIGAAAGAATALGASAMVGTIVGGALVGAATSGVITVIDNGFAGRDLTTGLGTAIVMGAIGGGIGGAAAGLLQGPMTGMTTVARYATQLGVDMTIDTAMNAVTGNLSWENFGTSLAMSMLVNGVTMHPRVAVVSEGLTSKGFGAGYDAGAAVRARATGTGGPGSQGAMTGREAHINEGDTLGPNSPYGQRWDFKGGGHNAAEFRARMAADGGSLADYQLKPVAEDAVTGVGIDEATRFRLQGNAASPTRATDPSGNPIVQDARKSLFPKGMDRPTIAAAGQRAVELALAGAPGTQHTPPPTPTQNGSFSAIVTTPEGHPILVEGHYKIIGGAIEVQTVYPVSDRAAGTVPVVPGSRTNVPGAATPSEYGYGDDD